MVSKTLAALLLAATAIPVAASAPGPTTAPLPSLIHPAMSDALTDQVVLIIEDGRGTCRGLPDVYQVDCYRQTFRRAGSKITRYPDYREARSAFRSIEKTLNAALKQYADRAAPPLRSGGNTYKPVTPAGVKPAAAAFDRARQEAATALLRARGPIKVHYERIAAVLGSNKLIIRSQLLDLLRRRA